MSGFRGREQEVHAALLRAWAGERDLHIRAAGELLAGHGAWPRRRGFTRVCASRDGREARIGWPAAGGVAGSRPGGSPGGLAILDLAVPPGQNRYRLPIIGQAGARLIALAIAPGAGAGR